jgi:hypothetical protein
MRFLGSLLTLFSICCQTNNILFQKDALARIPHINSPQDFLSKTLDLFRHIRYNEIFDPLSANQHSFSESTIQGELRKICALRDVLEYNIWTVSK